MNKILFILHESSRTGASIALLNLIKWLNSNHPEIRTDVLILKKGELHTDFTDINGKVLSIKDNFFTFILNEISQKFLKRNIINVYTYLQIYLNNYNLIYANTVVTIPIAVNIKKVSKKAKLLLHVHELNLVIKNYLPDFNKYIPFIDFFITASKAVQQNLIENYNVNPDLCKVVYEFSSVSISKNELTKTKNDFTIGGSGVVHWRKGYDIFISIAYHIVKKYPNNNWNFIWTGKINSFDKIVIENDIEKMGLNNIVHFTGELDNCEDIYNSFDVFLMTSREDPFPLVCIEVGMLGKPIICFESATGIEEIIKSKGGGFVVKYLDIDEVIEKIVEYKNNHILLEKHSKTSAANFSEFTPNKICPEIFQVINNL